MAEGATGQFLRINPVGGRILRTGRDILLRFGDNLAELGLEVLPDYALDRVRDPAQIGNLANQTGLTPEQIQRILLGASQLGIDETNARAAINELIARIGSIREGNSEYEQAFRDLLGPTFDFQQDNAAILDAVMDAFENMDPESDPAAIAHQMREIFGTTGPSLGLLMRRGWSGINDLTEGIDLYSEEETDSARELFRQINQLLENANVDVSQLILEAFGSTLIEEIEDLRQRIRDLDERIEQARRPYLDPESGFALENDPRLPFLLEQREGLIEELEQLRGILELYNAELAAILEMIQRRLDESGLPELPTRRPRGWTEIPLPPEPPVQCGCCGAGPCTSPDPGGGPWRLDSEEHFVPMSARLAGPGSECGGGKGAIAGDDGCSCQDADEIGAVTDAIRLSAEAVGDWRDLQRDLNQEIEITSLLGTQTGQVITRNFAAASAEIRVAQEALGQFGNALIEVMGALQQGGEGKDGGGFGGILGDLVGDLLGGGDSGGFLSDLLGGGDSGGFLSDLLGSGDSGGFLSDLAGSLPGFANGGRPPIGMPSLVGERGPEIFVPDVAGTILPNGAAPPINVNVINNTPAEVDVQQRGPDLDIVVGDMIDRQVARGRLDGSMRRRYGVSPSTAR